jgi:hypothetical protein
MSVLQLLVISSVARISDTTGAKLRVVELWQKYIAVECGEETMFWFAVGLPWDGKLACGGLRYLAVYAGTALKGLGVATALRGWNWWEYAQVWKWLGRRS